MLMYIGTSQVTSLKQTYLTQNIQSLLKHVFRQENNYFALPEQEVKNSLGLELSCAIRSS